MKKYKVLFADLVGTLIETASGKTFPEGIWDMKIKFDVLDAIKKLAPDCVFIVSNQGGVEKGFVDEFSISCKSLYISRVVKEYCNIGGAVRAKQCISNNKTDKYRKPNTGMLESFFDEYIPGPGPGSGLPRPAPSCLLRPIRIPPWLPLKPGWLP